MVNATLYLLHYNNYYNRVYKAESSLEGYLQYQLGQPIRNVNFIPNDYVNTTQIINWQEEFLPDYLLVVDEDQNIVSKWFIISNTRIRAGQLELELHRDLISDYYLPIVNAPMFIEKATVPAINDPAIYNNENMSFNQIKKAEYPLKDESDVAWIVGYVPKDSFKTDTTLETNYNYTGSADEKVTSLSAYKYYKYKDTDFVGAATNIQYGVRTWGDSYVQYYGFTDWDFTLRMSQRGEYLGAFAWLKQGGNNLDEDIGYTGNRTYAYKDAPFTNAFSVEQPLQQNGVLRGNEVFTNFTSTILNELNGYAPTYLDTISLNEQTEFLKQDGRIIYNEQDQQFYRVRVNKGNKVTKFSSVSVNSSIYNLLYNNINRDRFTGSPNADTFEVSADCYKYRVYFEVLSTKVSTIIKGENERYHLSDSPYDMFCLPFPSEGQEVHIYKHGSLYVDTIDRNAALSIASSIAAQSGQQNIYDLQLLPYCPVPTNIKADGTIDVGDSLISDVKIVIGTTEKKVNVVFWALKSQFTLNIPFYIPEGSNILDKKIKNETEFWRLCSPNYSGVFEFNPQKNNGVTSINIDCNYKPYNPYIHANINFKNLYGQDFNDSRGLVCGGDFSLPQVTSAWADYQLNNKNYQQMFDREIQNLEVNNNVQREREAWAVAGSAIKGVMGTAVGTVGGFAKGGIGGAIAGGVTGGIGSAFSIAKTVRDTQLNEQLRNETLDYKRDMFGYQLSNIQALPQGLAKVSAFTANNKIFPFLEHYDCTEIEKEALRNKLKYNGMTIMRIGTISQFQTSEQSYIKGKLIRAEDIEDDYHICNAIAEELDKGVFM